MGDDSVTPAAILPQALGTIAIVSSSAFRSTPVAGSAFSSRARSALLPGTESSHVGVTRSRGRSCPKGAVRTMSARLLLLCLLLRSSWLTLEGGREVSRAGVLLRGGRAAVVLSVGVAVGVPIRQPDRRFDDFCFVAAAAC